MPATPQELLWEIPLRLVACHLDLDVTKPLDDLAPLLKGDPVAWPIPKMGFLPKMTRLFWPLSLLSLWYTQLFMVTRFCWHSNHGILPEPSSTEEEHPGQGTFGRESSGACCHQVHHWSHRGFCWCGRLHAWGWAFAILQFSLKSAVHFEKSAFTYQNSYIHLLMIQYSVHQYISLFLIIAHDIYIYTYNIDTIVHNFTSAELKGKG